MVGADLRLQGNTVALRTVPGLRDKKRGVCTPERLSRHWYLCLQRGGPVYDWCFLGNNLEQSSVQKVVRRAQSVYCITFPESATISLVFMPKVKKSRFIAVSFTRG